MERQPKFTNQRRNQQNNAAANEKRRSKTSIMVFIAIGNGSDGDCLSSFATKLWDLSTYNSEKSTEA